MHGLTKQNKVFSHRKFQSSTKSFSFVSNHDFVNVFAKFSDRFLLRFILWNFFAVLQSPMIESI